MINAADIETASRNVRLKSRDCWVKKIGPNQFQVTPKAYRKSRRIVTFFPNMMVLCVSADTGEQCAANEHKTPCYHIVKAAEHLIRLSKRG